jgi:archaellum component FlaF (FlaF/FlaG flagellin family)
MIAVYVIVALLIIIGLIYVDKKSSYDEIPIFKWTKENGEFYFSVPYYIWQVNKIKQTKKIYSQNTILDFEGYKYQITNLGGIFPRTNGTLFLERELRFWGEPLNIIYSNSNVQITINQYGSGNVSINLNNNKYINDIINIQEYISKDTYIDGTDKQVMQDFISKILSEKSMEKKEVKRAYDTFLKYEPLLSFALNVLSAIKDFL